MTARRSKPVASATLWARVARDHATMLLAAGEVIGRRSAAMAAHGLAPNARERAELRTMVEEKQTAMFEGTMAAWSEMVALQQANWIEAMRLTMRGSLAMTPFAPFAPATSLGAGRRGASAVSDWTSSLVSPLDTQLKIFEAASKPFRQRVVANRKRLGA